MVSQPGFREMRLTSFSNELASCFDWIGSEPGQQNAGSIERGNEVRSGRKLLNRISELRAIAKDLSRS